MSTVKLTTYGFYHYMNLAGDDLFKNVKLPDGIDRDTLIGTILMRCGEFEVVYSDANLMQEMIGVWSKKNALVFDRLLEGINEHYNPINNYDRYEELHYTPRGKVTDDNSSTSTPGVTNTVTSIDEISAFDSEGFNNSGKSTTTSTPKGTDAAESHNTRSYDDYDEYHSNHVYGNIGVATSSAILKEFLEVQQWNIYDAIANLYADEFCIPIYY